ncbi:hypothetical protein GCM10027456_15100 [Kineosporia babensis]
MQVLVNNLHIYILEPNRVGAHTWGHLPAPWDWGTASKKVASPRVGTRDGASKGGAGSRRPSAAVHPAALVQWVSGDEAVRVELSGVLAQPGGEGDGRGQQQKHNEEGHTSIVASVALHHIANLYRLAPCLPLRSSQFSNVAESVLVS